MALAVAGAAGLAWMKPRPRSAATKVTVPVGFLEPSVPGAAPSAPPAGWQPPGSDDIDVDPATEPSGVIGFVRLAQQTVVSRHDFQKKWAAIERGAREGKTSDQFLLGSLLCQGLIVKRDVPGGLYWLKSAGAAGSAEAMIHLGELFRRGKVVPADIRNGLGWFHRAALTGNAMAERTVGWHLINGVAIDGDVAEGMRWFRRAADRGDTAAMVSLAGEYHSGTRVPRDLTEARRWFSKAAASGDTLAQERLAILDGKQPPEIPPAPRAEPTLPLDPWKILGDLYGAAAETQRRLEQHKWAHSFRNPAFFGRPAPALEAVTSTGEPVTLAAFRGRQSVWVTFSSPSCERSRAHASRTAALEKRLGSQVAFLTVLAGPQGRTATPADAAAWARAYGISPRRVLVDPGNRYMAGLGLGTTPIHVLVDIFGIVRFTGSGAIGDEQIQEVLRPVLY